MRCCDLDGPGQICHASPCSIWRMPCQLSDPIIQRCSECWLLDNESAGLAEEELDEEVTHGRNIQIRHHLPRHSVEARRSHSQADRWRLCNSVLQTLAHRMPYVRQRKCVALHGRFLFYKILYMAHCIQPGRC